jgi:hypothetical protein
MFCIQAAYYIHWLFSEDDGSGRLTQSVEL